MTPPRTSGNSTSRDTFPSLSELEGRVQNGEKDIEELRKAIEANREAARESSSEIKKMIGEDRLAVVKIVGDLEKSVIAGFSRLEGMEMARKSGRSDWKWAIGLVVTGVLSVAAIVLTVIGLVLKH